MPILCRVTSSMIGMVDPAHEDSRELAEKELLLCFRPICKDRKTHKSLHFHYQAIGGNHTS